MKKMPTLFVREFEERANGKGKRIIGCRDELTSPDLQCVLDGECVPTEKVDGAACAFFDGIFYKRFDAKGSKRRKKLESYGHRAIKCQEHHDPVTGSFPCWVPVDVNESSDKWFIHALENYKALNDDVITDGTYEAIGKHFNGNPYNMEQDFLWKHGSEVVDLEDFSYEGIKTFLENHELEGIVFWKDGEPLCKIKRTDFNYNWPIKKSKGVKTRDQK